MSNYVRNRVGFVIPNKEKGFDILNDFLDDKEENPPNKKVNRWFGYKIEENYCIFQFDTRHSPFNKLEEIIKKHECPGYQEYDSDDGSRGVIAWDDHRYDWESFSINVFSGIIPNCVNFARIREWINPIFYDIIDDEENLNLDEQMRLEYEKDGLWWELLNRLRNYSDENSFNYLNEYLQTLIKKHEEENPDLDDGLPF